MSKDALLFALPADILINKIFEISKVFPITDKLMLDALWSARKHYPPRKDETLGDRLNWACLLENIDEGSDLHLISQDGDFASKLDKYKMNPALESEWQLKKKTKIFFYKSLGNFFQKHFPEIKFTRDIDRIDAIEKLKNSKSFSQTHTVISELEQYIEEFRQEELLDLLNSALINPQIYWIGKDDDVSQFFGKMRDRYKGSIEKKTDDFLFEHFYIIPF